VIRIGNGADEEAEMVVSVPRSELIPRIKEYLRRELVVTVPILAREFGVSRLTAWLILRFLESEGFVVRKVLGKDVVYVCVSCLGR